MISWFKLREAVNNMIKDYHEVLDHYRSQSMSINEMKQKIHKLERRAVEQNDEIQRQKQKVRNLQRDLLLSGNFVKKDSK